MKQWRNTFLMLLVLVGLGAYVKLKENKPVRENPAVVEFDPKEVTRLELKSAKTEKPIVLTRKGDDWRMEQPFAAAADGAAVQTLLDSAKDVSALSSFQARELKKYGLEKPKAELKVTFKDGKTETLQFGDKAPGDINAYAMKPGAQRVYLVPGTVADAADKSTDDLRDKTAVRFDREIVTGFTLTQAAKSIEVAKETEMQWQMQAPLKAPADAVAIDGLLNTVKGLKATKFIVEKADDLKQYGLDTPALKFEVEQRKKSSVALLIGAKSKEDPTAVYAKASNETPVYLLSDVVLTQLKKEVNDLRGKNVLPLEIDKVTRMQLTSANGELDLERGGAATTATWKVLKPKELPADKVKVDSILSTLNNLKATEFVDTPGKDADYGFDKPQSKVTVWLEGGKAPYRTLVVGKKVTGPDALFVRIAGEPTVFKTTTSSTDEDNLKPKLSAVREKLVSKFDKDKAEKITLKPLEGKPIVIERSGKTDWKITSPEKADGNPLKIDSLLFTAGDLRGDEWIEDDPTDLAKYGFDQPRLEVEIRVKDGPTQKFAVGKRDAGKSYLLTRGKAMTVFTKTDFSLNDLFQDFAALRK